MGRELSCWLRVVGREGVVVTDISDGHSRVSCVFYIVKSNGMAGNVSVALMGLVL